jgi:hypothetical protein
LSHLRKSSAIDAPSCLEFANIRAILLNVLKIVWYWRSHWDPSKLHEACAWGKKS